MGRRAAPRFAYGDANARQQQLDVVLRQAAEGGHAAPYGESQGNDGPARALVGQAGDGNAEADVENREGESR